MVGAPVPKILRWSFGSVLRRLSHGEYSCLCVILGRRDLNGSVLVVLVERLGGFFFDGRRSCTEDSFAGHSGLYCGDYLTVSIVVCV